MTTLVLGMAGAAAGFALGGPVGANIGFLVGSMIGNLIDPPKIEGPRRSDLKLQVSEYGKVIPYVWGTGRLAGVVIDQTDLEEHKESSGGKGGPEYITYTYSASFLIALCKRLPDRARAIRGISRIWADGRLIWDKSSGDARPCVVYTGTTEQDVDPTFEAIHGVGAQPAYRNLAYVSFTDYMLTDYGDRIPMLEFEVYTESGDIPWRVSTFDSNPHAPSQNVLYGVGYSSGVISVGMDLASRYYENHWDIDGNATGTDVDIPIIATYNAAGLCAVANLPGIQVWGDDLQCGWYFGPNDGTAFRLIFNITANPVGGNLSGAAVGWATYQDGYIFAFAVTNTLHCHLVRWYARDGVPYDVSPTDVYDFGYLTFGSLVPGVSTDHKVYIQKTDTATMYVFDVEALTLLHTYSLPPECVSPYIFSVYNDMLVHNYAAGGGNYYCRVTEINGGAFTYVGQVPQYSGPNILLGTAPLVLGQDGVISLDPPNAPAFLYDVVNDLSSLTAVRGVGSPASDAYDTSELTDEVRWYAVANQMTVRNAIEPLRKGFMFDGVETDDRVVFKKRGATDSVVTLDDDDLDAREYGTEPGTPLTTSRERESGLPRTVSLRYIDVDADYQPGAQSSPRLTTESDSDVSLDLAIGFTATEALQKCWALQVSEWIERERFEWRTTREYAWVRPCDVVTVRGRVVRVTNVTESPAGVLTWQGVLHRPSIYTQEQTGGGSEGWTPQPGTEGKADTRLELFNIPKILDLDNDLGFHFAMCRAEAGQWPGATWLYSLDDVTYTALTSTTNEDTLGDTTTALGAYYGGNTVDEFNSVTVVLRPGGELSSVTLLQMLNGSNYAVIGEEVVQFRDATLVATDTYTLTGFLRGRRGTESAIGTHAAIERFALLNIAQIGLNLAEMFTTRYYKAVTTGNAIADATAQQFACVGIAARPYAPVQLGGGANGSGDVILNWIRRTRTGGAWVPFSDAALGETSERYVVQIWNSTYTQCARIIEGVTTNTTTYTAAMETADFGAAQEHIYFTVGQMGQLGIGEQARGVALSTGASDTNPTAPIQPYQSGPASPPATGNTVSQVMTTTLEETSGFVVGNTYVVQFTTRASPAITAGTWAAAEYQSAPTFRHAVVATDVDGINALGSSWGAEVLFDFGGSGIALANSTTYYIIIKCEYPDGTVSGPVGQDAKMRMSLLGVI